jgi:hypothetical protein
MLDHKIQGNKIMKKITCVKKTNVNVLLKITAVSFYETLNFN